MVNMNDKMKKIISKEEKQEGSLQMDNVLEEVVRNTRIIKDCIIYDKDETLDEDKINFNRIIQFVGDWTGYEVSCNELRFNRGSILPCHYLMFATRLSDMLSQKCNGKKIVVYISLYENELELRFHTHRKNEKLWLNEDLNTYDVPILCWF